MPYLCANRGYKIIGHVTAVAKVWVMETGYVPSGNFDF